MKLKAFLLISLAGATLAFSQAKSDVVGYVTLDVPAQSDARWGLPLERKPDAKATLSAAPSGSTLSVTGTPFSGMDLVGSSSNESRYVKFTSGVKEGIVVLVTANNDNTITLDSGADLTGVVAGDTINVTKFWTPASIFEGDTVPVGTQLLFFQSVTTQQGINLSADTILTFNGTNWRRGFSNDDNYEIYPYEGFILRNPSGAALSTTIEGMVSTSRNNFGIDKFLSSTAQDTLFSLNNPVDENVKTLDFPDALLGDQILIFDNTATGINKSASAILTYNGTEWRQGFGAADVELEGGKSYVYRRASAAPTGTKNVTDEQDYLPNL